MVRARSRSEVERVIATGYHAGYYGRVKNFPSNLRRELVRAGVIEEEREKIDVADLDDEDLEAADARITAWAQAVKKHDETRPGSVEE